MGANEKDIEELAELALDAEDDATSPVIPEIQAQAQYPAIG